MTDILAIPVDFSPESSNALALQERLRPKLLDAGYATPDLVGNFCEFITIMVGNAKTKDQINAELADLIGDDFDPRFTDWLFNEVNQLSHGQSNGHRMQEDSMETETQPHSSPAESTRRSLKDVSSSARSAAAPYPQPSRVYDQINRALERPPVTVKHSIPDIPNVPTGPRLQSSAGPIRRGRGPGRVVAPPMPPDFTSFMLANGMPPEMLQQMMAESANFPNQMFPGFPPMNLAERISDIPMDGSSGIVVADGNRSRCRHWPRCQLGTRCKFHHPSQICPDFPKCPNLAGTCRNIHVGEDIPESDVHVLVPQLGNGRPVNGHRPSSANGNTKRQAQRPKKPQEQVPLCKFGSKCTKPECIFAHPTPAGGPDAIVLRGEMCPDGRACTNPECDMGHPSPVVDNSKRKETENCRFFPNCTNPECPYKHPAVSVQKALSIPCKFGMNCTRPNCIYNHEIGLPCRYNPCLNEACLFKHVEGQQPNKNKVWTSTTDGTGTMAERKFAYDQAEESITVGGGMEDDDDTVVHE